MGLWGFKIHPIRLMGLGSHSNPSTDSSSGSSYRCCPRPQAGWPVELASGARRGPGLAWPAARGGRGSVRERKIERENPFTEKEDKKKKNRKKKKNKKKENKKEKKRKKRRRRGGARLGGAVAPGGTTGRCPTAGHGPVGLVSRERGRRERRVKRNRERGKGE